MRRRTYLHGLGAAGVGGVAGCLDAVPGASDDGTVLAAPNEPMDAFAYPTHGEEIPEFSVPDAFTGEEISPSTFAGERAFLLTFIFTRCPDGACPALLLRLRRAQELAAERGHGDDVAFLALTFDPEYDDETVLEEYADQQGVDLEAGNWHFLRPESIDEAKELLDSQFGLVIQKGSPDEIDHDHDGEHDHGDEDDHDHGEAGDDEDGEDGHDHDDQDGHEEDGHDHDDQDGHEEDGDHGDGHDHGDGTDYTFAHPNLVLLVNREGIVERSYPTREVLEDERQFLDDPSDVAEDLLTVVEG